MEPHDANEVSSRGLYCTECAKNSHCLCMDMSISCGAATTESQRRETKKQCSRMLQARPTRARRFCKHRVLWVWPSTVICSWETFMALALQRLLWGWRASHSCTLNFLARFFLRFLQAEVPRRLPGIGNSMPEAARRRPQFEAQAARPDRGAHVRALLRQPQAPAALSAGY